MELCPAADSTSIVINDEKVVNFMNVHNIVIKTFKNFLVII